MMLRLPGNWSSRLTIALVIVGLIAVLVVAAPAAPQPKPTAGAAPSAAQAVAAPKYVILSFDDGPHPKCTAQVLNILRAYGVKATFFEIGWNVARYPSLTRRAYLQGSSIQNHTYSHPDLRKVSWATFK